MKSLLPGRADLVRALRSGGPELQEAVAHFLGFERTVSQQQTVQATASAAIALGSATVESVVAPGPAAVAVPFWKNNLNTLS